MSRLLDVLLTSDPIHRSRLAQAGLALLLLASGMLGIWYFVWAGVVRVRPVAWWSAVTFAGMAVFYGLIRSGWSRRWHEPSLTVPQMVFALTSGAVAYALLGPGRGVVFPMVMVVLMFGMLIASPRQMRWVSAYAVAILGATMALMARLRPHEYPAAIEIGHFLIVATMLPGVSLLAARLSQMRHRARAQRAELAQALARLREHTTRDELTGLVNHRQMQVVMEQEHQRCVRSGQTFCLAMLDIDRFKAVNEAHGYVIGDTVLRTVAQEALRHVRGVRRVRPLGRRGLRADALRHPRGAGARRPRAAAPARLGAAHPAWQRRGGHHAVGRAGRAPCRRDRGADAGARRARALREAKAQGRNRVVVAP